nr:penicillin-binding protein 1B [Arenimonas sp.]
MSVPRSASPPKSGSTPARPRWRGWLLRGVLLALGLALGVGVPLFWVLDRQVRAEFDQLAWQVPTRVYARPLALRPGQRLDVATLELELAAASYRKDGVGELPGTYAREAGRFRIGTRAFVDLDGAVPARRLEVTLGGGRVGRISDLPAKRPLESARVDPARIATLYGGNVQEERRLVQL